MSKGSQNKFLPVYFGVLALGTVGLGYLAWSASSDAEEAESAFKKAQTDLTRLENEPLSRTEENAKKKKEMVDAYLKQVADLTATLRKYQANPTDSADPQALQQKLKKLQGEIKQAADGASVKIPEKFDFGMSKYLSDFAQDAKTAQALGAHLDSLHFIASSAVQSNVTSIDAFSRDDLVAEKDSAQTPPASGGAANRNRGNTGGSTATRPAPGGRTTGGNTKKDTGSGLDESKVLERQAVRMTVTGKNSSITTLLEKLANTTPETSPYFITIRGLRVENELKTGPQRLLEVKEDEVKEEGKEPYIIDAQFILGNQNVRAFLEMDIVRFTAEETEAKPAPAPTGNNSGANK